MDQRDREIEWLEKQVGELEKKVEGYCGDLLELEEYILGMKKLLNALAPDILAVLESHVPTPIHWNPEHIVKQED